MDCLGASESPKDYVTAGTASTEMHGCAEALWQDDLVSFACAREDLFAIIIYYILGTRRAI